MNHDKQVQASDFFNTLLGVGHLARVMYERICRNMSIDEDRDHKLQLAVASLVHDVGHGPFSHTLEEILKKASIPFHHETMTRRFIVESESPICAALTEIDRTLPVEVDAFFDKKRDGDHWRYRLVSSQMDADRLDYVQRDATFAGIKGHGFDIERLLDLLFVHENSLAVDRGAIESVEAYLVTLDHLWRSVYYHHAVRAATTMLTSLFKRASDLYFAGDKTVFASRGNREHPIERLFKDGAGIPLEIYVRLSDSSAWELVDYWRDSGDPILKDLSERICARDLLKTVDVDPTDIPRAIEMNEKVNQATRDVVGDAACGYYWSLDTPDRTSYKRYNWKPESHGESIWMTGGGLDERPIEEKGESTLVEALKDRRVFNRFVMLGEVREKLMKI